MVQRDYLLRIIEEFGQVLLYLADLRRNGQYGEAMKVIEGTMRRHLGLDLATANGLPAEDLVALAQLSLPEDANPALANGRLLVLAGLFEQQAEVQADQHDDEARDVSRLKALQIYLIVLNLEPEPEIDAAAAVDRLLRQLESYELQASLKLLLWRHFEQARDYARAENWLFDLVEDSEAPPDIVAQGLAFYDRLLSHSDEELAFGGLPRDEVLAGRSQLPGVRGER